MAPMTRSRANNEGMVNELTVLYYSQRASAGLIISESINISEQAIGSPYTPGIYTKEQIEAWKKVTKSVHDKGGVIYAQLWHTGRVGHSLNRKGELPVAPSAIGIEGQKHYTIKGMQDYETPHALTLEEIKKTVKDYKQAAINAMEAGFDGAELHAANGYLPNQFLADNANIRTDEYGGSLENKSRFTLEIMQELVQAVGNKKVGIRLSPTILSNGIIINDPIAQFTHLIIELDKMSLSYIHLVNSRYTLDNLPHYPKEVINTFGKITNHAIIAAGGYGRETGEKELEKGIADIISYGPLFLANPDLPKRFELNAELNQPDKDTFFGGGKKGYTDYPFLNKGNTEQ